MSVRTIENDAKQYIINIINELKSIDDFNYIIKQLQNKLDYIDIEDKLNLLEQSKYYHITNLISIINHNISIGKANSYIKMKMIEYIDMDIPNILNITQVA